MPRVPAICRNCGLIFPSGYTASLGSSIAYCYEGCPRCGETAEVLSGFTALINGVVAFVVSPSHTLDEKKLLFQTARDVGNGQLDLKKAASDLDEKSPDGGRLLLEWATFGLTFIATMATIGSFLLAYQESRGNTPLEDVAAQKFEEVICVHPQPDKRSNAPFQTSIRPVARPSPHQPIPEGSDGSAASPEPPNENRKSRRLRKKKERSKSGKKHRH